MGKTISRKKYRKEYENALAIIMPTKIGNAIFRNDFDEAVMSNISTLGPKHINEYTTINEWDVNLI